MTGALDVYANLPAWVAVAAAIAAAVGTAILYARCGRNVSRGRIYLRWLAAALTVSLPVVAALLWRGGDDGIAAALEAALSEAENRRVPAPRGVDPHAYARGLREHLDTQPGDARAWVLYTRALSELDRFSEAAAGYEKALALSPKVAKDPAVWCEYADAVAMVQGGTLAGRPRELIGRALALDLGHPRALEMAGSADYEQGRYEEALGYWRPLLGKLEPGSRMHRELAAAIERTQRLAAGSPAAAEKFER